VGHVVLDRAERALLHAKGHTVPVELAVTTLPTQGPPLFAVFLRDLSEVKRQEEALRRKDEALAQAQKLEAVGRLAGGIAHDFNNILVVILGFAEVLLREAPPGSPSRQPLETILKYAQRASELVRQLLTFSRKQAHHPRALNLNDLVAETEDSLRQLLGGNVVLRTALAADLGPVCVDPARFEQVLMNLATNARDAMPAGGQLLVETRNADMEEPYPLPDGPLPAGRYVLLALTDTGCGMDEATRAKMFEPFFTTKEQGKGTGLGMATVFGTVRQAGGHLCVDSALGRGTTIKIYLPWAGSREAPSGSRVLPALRGRGTALVVEDEQGVRELLRRELTRLGYAVLTAATPEEGLKACQEHPGALDLLLTDVSLPGMSGPELAERAAALRPKLRVLFASGYPERAGAARSGLGEGAIVLEKPFSRAELARKVQEALGRGGSPAPPRSDRAGAPSAERACACHGGGA
jgi:signal transduction histidine kinase/CheY-like chemotaxis protein